MLAAYFKRCRDGKFPEKSFENTSGAYFALAFTYTTARSRYAEIKQTEFGESMDILLFFAQVLAGTGVFLVGVGLLTSNIEQLATSGIKTLFNKTGNKKLVNVGIGMVTTALIQSSGVTTVLIVGFVNVGLMSLNQATAMIMGANIGTTITAQIAALSGFDFTTYIQVLAFAGIMTAMIAKKDSIKKVGYIIAGLGLVFIGLKIMSGAMSANSDLVQPFLQKITNPFLLFFVGILLTALVQSSSATTSIIIAMVGGGLVIGTGGNEVLFFILGTNIGSCVTALMSTIGASSNAKRTGVIHLLFNTLGSLLFFCILIPFPQFMEVTFKRWFTEPETQIAMFHTFFNVTCTIVFLPVSNLFVKISEFIIRDKTDVKEKDETTTFLDDRMLSSASLAISQIEKETVRLLDKSMDAFLLSYKAFNERNMDYIPTVKKEIEETNDISQNIIDYLIKVAALSKLKEERVISDIHNNVGDIMRIAEIADNFTKYTNREIENKLEFSVTVLVELDKMVESIKELYGLTRGFMLSGNKELLPEVDAVEDEIDTRKKLLIDGHIQRLNEGTCRPESSSVFINLVSNLERLGDHITYIAHSHD